MKLEKPIKSGILPGTGGQSHDYTVRYLEQLQHQLDRMRYGSPLQGERVAQDAYALFSDVQGQAQVISVQIQRMAKEYMKSKGAGLEITDSDEVFSFLKGYKYRITAGPTLTYMHTGYDWRLAFPLASMPEALPLVGKDGNALLYRTSRYNLRLECPTCSHQFEADDFAEHCPRCQSYPATPREPGQVLNRRLNDLFAPLVARGYEAGLVPEKVTKTNFIARLYCETARR